MEKNRAYKIMAIEGSIFLVIMGILVFSFVHNNHQANQLIIEKCFENFDKATEVVVTQNGLWSPVICERK